MFLHRYALPHFIIFLTYYNTQSLYFWPANLQIHLSDLALKFQIILPDLALKFQIACPDQTQTPVHLSKTLYTHAMNPLSHFMGPNIHQPPLFLQKSALLILLSQIYSVSHMISLSKNSPALSILSTLFNSNPCSTFNLTLVYSLYSIQIAKIIS